MAKPYTYYPVTMASFSTLTSAVDLGGSWTNAYLEIPAMTSGTALCIQAAATVDGTFRRVKHPSINSSTSSSNTFEISSLCTNCYVPIPSGLRFVKVEATAIVSFSPAFNIVVGD